MNEHGTGQPSMPGSRVPIVVFYDIMHEAATRVRGVLGRVDQDVLLPCGRVLMGGTTGDL